MLDLQARVHLHEIELAVFTGDEFNGAGTAIVDRARRRDGRIAHSLAHLIVDLVEKRRRCFFENFLMPALDRAFALKQVHHIAVGVAKHLKLDMVRAFDIAFDQYIVIAERILGLPLGGVELRRELVRTFDQPHAFTAASGDRFDELRVADLFGLLGEKFGVLIVAVIAGHHRHASFFHQRLGGTLGTHLTNRIGGRADKHNTCRVTRFGEHVVFRQKPVAGVHGLGTASFGDSKNGFSLQIRIGRARATNMKRLVGQHHVLRIGVGVRVDRDRLDAEAFTGTHDAAGNFAAIGDENFGEHVSPYCLSNSW